MAEIARAVDDLTEEWFEAALGHSGAVATEVVGTGQMGLVVRATLGGAEPRSVIVKLASADAGSRQIGVALGVYEAEVRFYEEIAPTTRMSVPACHFSAVEPDTGWFTLVFDDLSGSAAPGDVIAGGSVDQAALALGELVGLQAPEWNSPALLGRTWLADTTRTANLFAAFPAGLEPFLERFGTGLEPAQLALIERALPRALEWFQGWHGPFAVQHGDYRLDNMLFATTADARPLTVVDWQTARLGPPLLDVAYYLGVCLDPDERRANERALIADYHRELVAAGVAGFGFDACWDNYRRYSLYGLYLGVGMATRVEQTERGDAMFLDAVRRYADLALELEAGELLAR
jgi:hypothetical protein